jgi:multidrug efflux pump subunit AcrA (membrane-fusion protein)
MLSNIKGFTILLYMIILIMPSLSGCGSKQKEAAGKAVINVAEVKKESLKESLSYVGDIKAEDEVIIYPKVAGKIIEEVAKEGDCVERGDILAYIDRDEVGFKFEKAPVESPIDGIVGKIYIDKGSNVSLQTPICLVVNMDIVKVIVNVVEKDIPKVKEGQGAQIRVDAYPGEFFKGTIERVSPVVDLATRTATLEIKISNDDHRLKPGMFARVKIDVLEHKGVPCILRDAIIKKDNGVYCFIIKDGKACKTKITTGMSEDGRVEVTNGIQEGDVVVITGQQGLKNGQIVKIISKGAQE